MALAAHFEVWWLPAQQRGPGLQRVSSPKAGARENCSAQGSLPPKRRLRLTPSLLVFLMILDSASLEVGEGSDVFRGTALQSTEGGLGPAEELVKPQACSWGLRVAFPSTEPRALCLKTRGPLLHAGPSPTAQSCPLSFPGAAFTPRLQCQEAVAQIASVLLEELQGQRLPISLRLSIRHASWGYCAVVQKASMERDSFLASNDRE